MIKLVLCYDGGGAVVPPNFEFLSELLQKTGSESLKKERRHAYITLKLAYEYLFGETLPEILKDSLGRPYLSGSHKVKDFSLSHTDGLVAVAFLTESGRVGVDTEVVSFAEKNSKIHERFLKNVNVSLPHKLENIEVYFFHLSQCGLVKLDTPLTFVDLLSEGRMKGKTDDFFSLWCTLEATLKADGVGFSKLSNIENLLSSSYLSLFSLENKEEKYRVALSYMGSDSGQM